MTEQTTADVLNRSNKNRIVDNFYVSYLKLPDNISNLLGRQTLRLDRPTINFETSQIRTRGSQYTDKSQVRFSPVNITLYDDESAITSQFLYTQIFRQMNKMEDLYGKWDDLHRDYRFDLKVEVFDSADKMMEGFVLRDCFISNINHSQLDISSDTNAIIDIVLEYDNIDIFIVDEYHSLK